MSYNKWKFSITLLFVIISWSAIAQDQFISLKGGLNITKIQSDGLFSPNDARKGFVAGVGYEYHLGTGIFLGADLLYNQRGYTNDAYLMSDNGSNIKEKVTFEYDYNYISLPLKVGYKSGSTKISAFGNVGLVPSLLVYAEITEPSLGELLEGKTTTITKKANRFDLAGMAEIGGLLQFSNEIHLFTSVAFQHSLTSITNDNYFSESKARHYGVMLTLGLKKSI